MSTASRIPLFPLNAVLFPDGRLPLRVFEARYMDMTRDCMRHATPFGVCLIREGREVGKPATPEPIGCLGSSGTVRTGSAAPGRATPVSCLLHLGWWRTA